MQVYNYFILTNLVQNFKMQMVFQDSPSSVELSMKLTAFTNFLFQAILPRGQEKSDAPKTIAQEYYGEG